MAAIQRLWAYGLVLTAGALLPFATDANPGAGLLAGRSVITVVGAVLLVRFLAQSPRQDA